MCKALRIVFFCVRVVFFGRRVRIDNFKTSIVCKNLCELHTLLE